MPFSLLYALQWFHVSILPNEHEFGAQNPLSPCICEHWIELFRHVVFAYSGTGMIMWFIKHSTVEYYLKRCKKKNLDHQDKHSASRNRPDTP